MHSQAIEDYLKTIYKIGEEQGRVTTVTLAQRLGVAPASVTGMLKKLASMGMVSYEPYRGVALTDSGRQMALEVIRHHRLIELYLANVLGVPWDQVHGEAEKWEHVLSEALEERIDNLLGHPTVDPHGAPIPTRDGRVAPAAGVPLLNIAPGQSAVLVEVSDEDASLLRYVAGLGLYPGTVLNVVAKGPFDGSLTIRVGDAEHMIGRAAAAGMLVHEIDSPPPEVS